MPASPFHYLANFIIRAHRAILLVALLLALLSFGLISRLQIDFSLDSLLPSDDLETRQLLEDLKDAGTQDILIALVTLSGPDRFEDGKMIVDEFARQISSVPSIGSIEASVTERQRAFFTELLMPNAALFLSEADRHELLERLSARGIEQQVQENKRFLTMPMQGGAGELILRDPLGLRTLWLSRLLNDMAFGGLNVVDGYLTDRERRRLLVFIHPEESARNIPYTKMLMAAAQKASDSAIEKWRQEHPGSMESPSIAFAGGYPIAFEDEALTRKDLQGTLLVALVGVNLLFYLVFRDLRILALVLGPLAVGISLTFGFMQMVFGHVNVLTGAFGGVLLGLGTDFAIYFLNFYLAAYAKEGCTGALHYAMEKSGRGIVVGGVTSAAGFLTLGISSFRGFRELGIITGTGLIFCLSATLLVLPALLVWDDHRRKGPRQVRPVSSFGLNRLFRLSLTYPRRVIGCFALLLGIFFVAAFQVSFDEDLRSLRPQQSSHHAAQKQVESIMGGAGAYLVITMEDESQSALLNRALILNDSLGRLQAGGRLAHYKSVLSYIPAPDAQHEALKFFETHSEKLDPVEIEYTFKRALEENGFQFLPEYETYLQWLKTLLRPRGELGTDAFEKAGLLPMLDRFLVRSDTGFKLLTYIQPKKSLWTKADLESFIVGLEKEALTSGLEPSQWRLGGFPMLSYHLKRHVLHDLGNTVILAGIAIIILVFMAFRRPLTAALAATPLIAALITMLGGMAILSLRLNFANFIVLPFMIGICINDGVLIMNSWSREPESDDLSVPLEKIGRAVLLTSLTTLVGFGSLICSHYPGLRSIGWLSVLGIFAELSASLLLLPAILAWIERKSPDSRRRQARR